MKPILANEISEVQTDIETLEQGLVDSLKDIVYIFKNEDYLLARQSMSQEQFDIIDDVNNSFSQLRSLIHVEANDALREDMQTKLNEFQDSVFKLIASSNNYCEYNEEILRITNSGERTDNEIIAYLTDSNNNYIKKLIKKILSVRDEIEEIVDCFTLIKEDYNSYFEMLNKTYKVRIQEIKHIGIKPSVLTVNTKYNRQLFDSLNSILIKTDIIDINTKYIESRQQVGIRVNDPNGSDNIDMKRMIDVLPEETIEHIKSFWITPANRLQLLINSYDCMKILKTISNSRYERESIYLECSYADKLRSKFKQLKHSFNYCLLPPSFDDYDSFTNHDYSGFFNRKIKEIFARELYLIMIKNISIDPQVSYSIIKDIIFKFGNELYTFA
jgi:hypothetical protein